MVYVCFDKKQNNTLSKRKRILDANDSWKLRSASHWPNKMKLFGQYPRNYGNHHLKDVHKQMKVNIGVFTEMPMPKLTDYGRKIALG